MTDRTGGEVACSALRGRPDVATAHPGGAALPGDDRSRTFAFEHKLFAVEGCYFALIQNSEEVAFHLPLGDLKGAIALPVLRAELKLASDGTDSRLLDIVEKSLRYVKEIRPNDSIPHELLDG